MILAGDIGGTKCNLALYEIDGEFSPKVVNHRYESREFPSFDELIAKFLRDTSAGNEKRRRGSHRSGRFWRGRARDRSSREGDQSALGRRCAPRWPSSSAREHVVLLNDLEATALQSGAAAAIGDFHSQSGNARRRKPRRPARRRHGPGRGDSVLGRRAVRGGEFRGRPHGFCAAHGTGNRIACAT